MKKYIDSKNGIYTDGYNHYVVDLSVYPFLTDAATINNADELISILTKVHAHGGQLTVLNSGTGASGPWYELLSLSSLGINTTTKTLYFQLTTSETATGAEVKLATCTYSSGTWTVALSTATTAWDT